MERNNKHFWLTLLSWFIITSTGYSQVHNVGKVVSYKKISGGIDPAKRQILFGAQEGKYTSVFRNIQLILHGFPAVPAALPYPTPLLDPMGDMQDLYDPVSFRAIRAAEPSIRTKALTVHNFANEITIGW